ncbi:hypothetical protein Clacol_000522 [Clathrus columnatus]|uniref:Glycosyltransferase family 15 protein n=1 Tax=Clathrus columnatus TaxID=1419009 RepID=A0AAV4ZWN5_9AGAM|nr:hypothetical protein Clacol_000522 [Clathrus columnatus]
MQPAIIPFDRASTKQGKPNAVIVMLVASPRLPQAVVAIRNIEERFNRRLKYPYVIFTEANVEDDIKDKLDWITEGRLTWAGLPSDIWGLPSFLDRNKVENSMNTIGHPATIKYDWIWRLDSDIEFHCDVPYDPIARVRDAGALYSFIQISNDARSVQPSLGSNISAFLASHKHLLPPHANHKFVWKDVDKALDGKGGDEDWTLLAFYVRLFVLDEIISQVYSEIKNNFEISHRSLWDNPLYLAYFDFLDQAGGFFYERWGDSLVHAHAVSMSLRPDQVVQFTDMGYEHQKWDFECPQIDRCTCFSDPLKPLFDNRGYEFNLGGSMQVSGYSELSLDLPTHRYHQSWANVGYSLI